MSKTEILIKIAEGHEELGQLYRRLANNDFQSPTVQGKPQHKEGSNELRVLCGCDKPAKRIEGKAKSGRNAGKPYVMYVCDSPKDSPDSCGFRKFEDQILKEGGAM